MKLRNLSIPSIKIPKHDQCSKGKSNSSHSSTKKNLICSTRSRVKQPSIYSLISLNSQVLPKTTKILNKSILEYVNIDMELRDSQTIYDDYKKLINPEKPYINSLSPKKRNKKLKYSPSKFEMMPAEGYSSYKNETMHLFKNIKFRISKARDTIKIAKQLSCKYK